MAVQISTALAIYFVIWWLALFLTLPFGVRSQHEDGGGPPGTDPGAPVLTGMKRKLIWTTIVSVVVFAACYVVYVHRLVTLEGLYALFGLPAK